jgi:hypothetical protein
MKRIWITIMGTAFWCSVATAQQTETVTDPENIPKPQESQPEIPQDGVQVDEPSGAEPAQPVFPPTPGVPNQAAGSAAGTPATTITISQTFTNEPAAITVLGEVSSDQEKQAIETALQQAAPGRIVNNRLKVAGPTLNEPAGAERENGSSSTNQLDETREPKENQGNRP